MTANAVNRTAYALALAAICTAPSAGAQDKVRDYPTRPIRIVIGIAPPWSTMSWNSRSVIFFDITCSLYSARSWRPPSMYAAW